jgi:hypothetical protein
VHRTRRETGSSPDSLWLRFAHAAFYRCSAPQSAALRRTTGLLYHGHPCRRPSRSNRDMDFQSMPFHVEISGLSLSPHPPGAKGPLLIRAGCAPCARRAQPDKISQQRKARMRAAAPDLASGARRFL